jgi:hypothetical protein
VLGSRAIFGLSVFLGVWSGCDAEPRVVPDRDQDGFPADQDCDDDNADAFPGALELCDGADNDCDGTVDVDPLDGDPYWPDADGDGFGDASATPVLACAPPEGLVDRAGDCDDTVFEVYPGRVELCNGIDDDCTGIADDEPETIWYPDVDGDGFGDAEAAIRTCDPDPALIEVGGDCNDALDTAFPGADERCDGVDNDCDGLVDDEDPDRVDPPPWFPDADEDGFGTPTFSVEQCTPPLGSWAASAEDCDDFAPDVFPGALERCNGRDDDCDGAVDTPDAPAYAGPAASLSLSAAGPRDTPVFVSPVDLQQVFEDAGGTGPVDPSALRVAIGSCDAGQIELPVRFLDTHIGAEWGSLVADPDGDAIGALVVPWDGAFDGSLVTGALHFASSGPLIGDAEAAGSTLSSGAVAAEVSDGGHLVGFAGPDGPVLLDQAAFQPRLDTPAGTLFLSGGMVALDAHPAVSILAVEGAASNAVADVVWRAEWLVASGSPALLSHLEVTTQGDTTLVGAVEWRDGVVALAAGVGQSVVTSDSVVLDDGSAGVRATDAPGPWTSGSAGASWVEIRGTDVDGPVTPIHTVLPGVSLVDVHAVWAAPGSDATAVLDTQGGTVLQVGP